MASTGSPLTGRGSIPCARSRSSTPTRPGSSSASSASSSSASAPIVATPAATSRTSRLGPDAGQRANRQPGQERRLPAPRHDGDPAGLSGVRRDLRDDLAGGDAQRAREPHALAHRELHQLGLLARVAVGQHEVALVDPDLLDHRRHLVHERPHPRATTRGTSLWSGRTNITLRAAAAGLGARHRRADAVPAGLVARRGHDAAAVRVAADDHGLAPQPRISVELHRREECVEVEMRDHECNLARSGARSGRGGSRRPVHYGWS